MNPFKDHTPEMIEAHNRRVAERKRIDYNLTNCLRSCPPKKEEAVATPFIKQSHKSPTKLHQDWGVVLKVQCASAWIKEEALTLKLCNGVRYTADWVVVEPVPIGYKTVTDAYRVTAYECKGYMRDDARKSLLFAAKEYPWIKFVLVWKEKGAFKTQDILP